MAMTAVQMVELVEIYLARREKTNFLFLLNNAYRYVISKLHLHYLNPLQVLEEDLPLDSNGWYDLGNLANTIREKHRGIVFARYDGGAPCFPMSEIEMAECLTEGTYPDSSDPRFFPWGDKIQCWPHNSLTDVATGSLVVGTTYYNLGYTTVVHNSVTYTDTQSFVAVDANYTTTGSGIVATGPQLIDIYYLKTETALALSGSNSVFEDRVNEIVCKIACGSMNMEEYQLGLALLKEYNEEAPATASNIIGRGPIDNYDRDRDRGEGNFNITLTL